MSRFVYCVGAVIALIALDGCRHEGNNFIYMPDMVYSPAFKAQQGEMRVPVKGTVPRDFEPFPSAYLKDPELAGRELKNPLPRTRQVLERGRALFNTYCIVCHGPVGNGGGSIVPKFPNPPSLQSDKVRGWSDGRIYYVVSNGQNLMPSYASQILPGDRWAIIHYVRVLQRSQNPTPQDVEKAEQLRQGK